MCSPLISPLLEPSPLASARSGPKACSASLGADPAAAAEYAARPPQPLEGARRSERGQTMSESYSEAVEEYRLWMKNTKGREDDFKNGRTLRQRFDPDKNMEDKAML